MFFGRWYVIDFINLGQNFTITKILKDITTILRKSNLLFSQHNLYYFL